MRNLSDDEDINRAWENFKDNVKTSDKKSLGLHELKQHKPWFAEEGFGFLRVYQRKQDKMQWVQDPRQSIVDNLNLASRDVTRDFKNKKKVYLKAKILELETNSKIKNIRDLYRDISDFKKGYQPRTNVVKDEKGDLVADSYNNVVRWRNHFSQQLNVHGVNDIKHTHIHTAEPLVAEPSAFEVQLAM